MAPSARPRSIRQCWWATHRCVPPYLKHYNPQCWFTLLDWGLAGVQVVWGLCGELLRPEQRTRCDVRVIHHSQRHLAPWHLTGLPAGWSTEGGVDAAGVVNGGAHTAVHGAQPHRRSLGARQLGCKRPSHLLSEWRLARRAGLSLAMRSCPRWRSWPALLRCAAQPLARSPTRHPPPLVCVAHPLRTAPPPAAS